MGSGVVCINSQYENYLLADSNPDLINFFTILQKEGETFIEYCKKFFKEKNNCKEKYYEYRIEFNHSRALRRRSALFLYLNRHGYNGLCRYNQSGEFNVPFGSYIRPYFPFREMHYFLSNKAHCQLMHADFRKTFAMSQPGDVIYCDPPYVPLSKTAHFSAYTGTKFSMNDQQALAELASESCKKNITVLISNHDTLETRALYEQAKIISFPVGRFISCSAAGRKSVQELIAVFQP